ncbi:hypothetical protein M422DRAFT_277039 [Sphaerobolus stellatus SS14]|uniref:Uncharacterized protein n=1 Tax=Sphaerobolus stellatus (strain SS14) TaxID=990650 RepID=A0A0C9U0M9_SPHS4|nr:hypothetical protein M422DRAFT_277039 [Sphaerobolus stellatus SS14]
MQPFAFRVKVRIKKGVVRSSDWDTVARLFDSSSAAMDSTSKVPVKLAKVIKVSAPVVPR